MGEMSKPRKSSARPPKARADKSEAPVTTELAKLVAAYARCDERTARRYLEGAKPHGRDLAERLEAAEQRARHKAKP